MVRPNATPPSIMAGHSHSHRVVSHVSTHHTAKTNFSVIMSNHHRRRREEIMMTGDSSVSHQSNNIRNHVSATRARGDRSGHAAATAPANKTAMRSDATTPPSQVTFEGDTVSSETVSTTASASSRRLPSPARCQASSEVSCHPKKII